MSFWLPANFLVIQTYKAERSTVVGSGAELQEFSLFAFFLCFSSLPSKKSQYFWSFKCYKFVFIVKKLEKGFKRETTIFGSGIMKVLSIGLIS